jgi:hypothetical protein
MTLIGPAAIAFDGGINFGDFLTSIQRTAPAPVVAPGINRDFSQTPSRGYAIVLTGVEEDLTAGTLWRWLHDHANETDVPVTWSTQADGGVSWSGVASSIPDPSQGGAANAHGTFTITIALADAPTLIDPSSDATWTIAITGTPTGGTYTLTVNGAATTPLVYNATTAVALAAVNALAGVTGLDAATVSGTAASYVLTFTEPVTVGVSHALTGGTSPNATATA